jgi:hypothetical protein
MQIGVNRRRVHKNKVCNGWCESISRKTGTLTEPPIARRDGGRFDVPERSKRIHQVLPAQRYVVDFPHAMHQKNVVWQILLELQTQHRGAAVYCESAGGGTRHSPSDCDYHPIQQFLEEHVP